MLEFVPLSLVLCKNLSGVSYSVPRHFRGLSSLCYTLTTAEKPIFFFSHCVTRPPSVLCYTWGPGNLYWECENSVAWGQPLWVPFESCHCQGYCQGKGAGPFCWQTQKPLLPPSSEKSLSFLSGEGISLSPLLHSLWAQSFRKAKRGLLPKSFYFLLCKTNLWGKKQKLSA